MIVRNGPEHFELVDIIKRVSSANYDRNLIIKDSRSETNTRATIVRFTLRVVNSSGPGAHQSTSYGGKRRRTVAACWHAHRDVLRVIFTRYPNATIRSAFATYNGRASFNRTFPATYDHNAGCAIEPVMYGDLCECDDADDMSEHTLGNTVDNPVHDYTQPASYSSLAHRMDGAHRWAPADDVRFQAAETEMSSWREFVDSLPDKSARKV